MPDRTLAEASSATEDYTGHERDAETGLHYAGARYYMSALGRWTSVDPLADAQHLLPYSPYHYSYNNPLSYTDPDGKNPILRGLKVVKRAYQAYKRGDNLASLKTWKKMGVDEVAGFVDNVRTLADGTATADDAFAVIDLVTGFGGEAKRGAKALGVVDEAGDAKKSARFVSDTDGKVIDTHSTPPGTYRQPDGTRTDVLQERPHYNKATGEDHGTTHTHERYRNEAPYGKVYEGDSDVTHRPTYKEVKNIEKILLMKNISKIIRRDEAISEINILESHIVAIRWVDNWQHLVFDIDWLGQPEFAEILDLNRTKAHLTVTHARDLKMSVEYVEPCRTGAMEISTFEIMEDADGWQVNLQFENQPQGALKICGNTIILTLRETMPEE
jgi:RHS repeat-associated protein